MAAGCISVSTGVILFFGGLFLGLWLMSVYIKR